MKNCTLCNGAYEFNAGIVGKNYKNEGLMFILHKSDSRALNGYSDALRKTNTGRTVDNILDMAGLNLDDIVLTNFYKCLLPNDKNPNSIQYNNCKKVLNSQIKKMNPQKIVLFGAPVYSHFFDDPEVSFSDVVGKVVRNNKISSFISYHPSGLRLQSKNEKDRIMKGMLEYISA